MPIDGVSYNLSDDDSDVEGQILLSEEIALIIRSINALPTKEKQVFLLKYNRQESRHFKRKRIKILLSRKRENQSRSLWREGEPMKNYENLVDEHLEFMIRLACEAQEDAEIDELIAESQLEHTPEEKEITRNAYLLFQRKLAEQEQKERKQYFPDRLTDHYKEKGYFDFHASAFIGEGKNSVDGILLRTDIEGAPAMLYHILLHELAHVFYAHNELGGRSGES